MYTGCSHLESDLNVDIIHPAGQFHIEIRDILSWKDDKSSKYDSEWVITTSVIRDLIERFQTRIISMETKN